MRKIFSACCAEATTPPTAIVTTTASVPSNFRYFDIAQYMFWILDFRLSDKESSNRIQDRSIMLFSRNRKPVVSHVEPSAIKNLKSKIVSSNHPVRSRQHLLRN